METQVTGLGLKSESSPRLRLTRTPTLQYKNYGIRFQFHGYTVHKNRDKPESLVLETVYRVTKQFMDKKFETVTTSMNGSVIADSDSRGLRQCNTQITASDFSFTGAQCIKTNMNQTV